MKKFTIKILIISVILITTTANAATVLFPTQGGTGLSSYTVGDILYSDATNSLTVLNVGSDTEVLTLSGGVPTWVAPASAGANTALSNLASVAINTSLLSDTADTDSLGSTAKEWLNLYIGDAGRIYFGLGQDISMYRSGAGTLSFDNADLFTNGTITGGGTYISYLENTGDIDMGTATLNAGVFSMMQGEVASDPEFTITQTGNDVVINQTVGNLTITAVGTASLVGNASTSTALAANPTDCGGGEFANAIDASGNLTCAAPAGGGDVLSVGDCLDGACLDGSSDGGTYISFYDAQGAGQLITGNLTEARVWTTPDATGTLALTSDLTSYLALAGGTMAGAVDMGNYALTNAGAAGNDFGASNTLVATTFSGAIGTGANDITLTGAIGRDTDNELNWGTDNSLAIVINGTTSNIVSISTGTGDNDKLVTQGYVDDAIPAVGASTALDNLASVAINESLVSDTYNTDALGTSTKAWSDLFLGTGSVIEWSSAASTPDITLTHSAETLTFAGGTIALGTATATGGLTGDITGNCSGQAGTVATITGLAPDTATTQATQGNITSLGTLTALTVDNININGSTITGVTADANTVLTAYAGKAIAIEGVSFDGGQVTGISALGVTGTRVTQGWFADIESTNDITIGGTALASIYSPIAGGAGILTVGALDSGSITSGFGTIATGDSISGSTLVATAASSLTLGTSSSADAGIIFKNATNANTVTIQSGATSTSYTLTLPLAVAGAGEVLTDAAGNGVLSWAATGAGATAYDDIGDPDAATTIVFDDNEVVFYETAEDTGAFLYLKSTDADLSGDTTLLTLGFQQATDANQVYLQCKDTLDDVPAVVFQIGVDGNTTIGGTLGVTGAITGALTGNASTATALAGNGANCNAGEYALGVDASGAVESCTDATTEINTVVATKDECSEITNCVPSAWDALTDMVLTDTYIYVGNASNDPVGVAMSSDCTISNTGAITCDHDALDNFVANEHLDWTSDLGAVNIHTGNYPISDNEVPNNITIDLATLASTLTVADTADTDAYIAIWDSASGSLAGKTDAGITYNAGTGMLSVTGITSTLTGNASTATALAANPGDCGANTWATTIAANGDLTCAAVTYAGISAMTSANWYGVISDETGSAAGSPLMVFNQAPTIDSPTFTTAITATGLIVENHLAASLVFDDGDLLDFGTFVTGATEGIMLPAHATDCSTATAEGQVCWQEDTDVLYVGDGAAAVLVGPGAGGGETLAQTLAIGADANDLDITSLDKLEGVDAQVYIDLGTNSFIELEADGGVQFGSAGVQILDDGDGAITISGLGDGADENLVINFDDTADEIDITSGTGVANIDFNTINLMTDLLDLGTNTLNDTDLGYILGWKSGVDGSKIDGEDIYDDTIDNDSIDWADMTDLTTDGAVVWGNIAAGELANDSIIDADIDDDGNFAFTGRWDFGGGDLEIPQGATVTDPSEAGEIAIDTTSDQFLYYGGAQRVLTYQKEICVALEDPTDADDNIPFFFPRHAIAITDVYCQVDGGTSVAMVISDGTNALESITCDADGAEDDGSIANGAFTALERMEFDLNASSGTNTWLNICVTYTITAD